MNTLTIRVEPTTAGAPEVFQRLGVITRQLHDTLTELGVMPRLQDVASGLPDARSRLTYIAHKTSEAANKVLNSVDLAKAEQHSLAEANGLLVKAIAELPVSARASGAVMTFVREVEASTVRMDKHLTDIMMAQDFHDLTGQVVAKVVALATDLEASLVKLLMQAAPLEHTHSVDYDKLDGPVVNPEGRTDVVSNQSEVDDLLASMGF
jgi:chemotaxis protein CheZ